VSFSFQTSRNLILQLLGTYTAKGGTFSCVHEGLNELA
jgi:hypothetical protein